MDNENKRYKTIPVLGSTKTELAESLPKGKTWNQAIKDLMDNQIPPDVQHIIDKIKETEDNPEAFAPLTSSGVVGKIFTKVGLVLGYTSDRFTDFGVSKVSSAHIVSFLAEDDYASTVMIVTGGLQTLIKKFGAANLEPYLEYIKKIVATHAMNVYKDPLSEGGVNGE